MHDTLTERELDLFNRGLARIHNGRLIPVMRGGDETDEERVAREAAEAAAAAAAEADKKFTQADLDRIVSDRLARDRKDRPTDAEIAQLREKATKYDEHETANQSELERERAAREKAEQERDAATKTANERLVQAAVLTQATAQKAIKPEHLHKLIDTGTVTVGDDGQVTGAEEAVKAFLEANPEYVGTGTTKTDVDQGARTKTGAEQLTSTDGMSAEEIAAAVADGKLDNYLATKT